MSVTSQQFIAGP